MSHSTSHLLKLLLTAACCIPAFPQTAAPTAFVTLCCNAPATVTVFNPADFRETRTILAPTGGGAIAVSPDGARLFVTSYNKPLVQITDVSTGSPLAKILLPVQAANAAADFLAVSPDSSRLYALVPFDSNSSTLFAIDTATGAIINTLHLPAYSVLQRLVVSIDGKQLYSQLQNGANYSFQVIDAVTLTLGASLPIPQFSTGLAVTPAGLVLLPEVTNTLLVIDPKQPSVIHTFPLPAGGLNQPGPIISSLDGKTGYLAYGGPTILAIDLTTGTIVFQAPVTGMPLAFALSHAGTILYAINDNSTVSKFDLSLRKTIVTLAQPAPLAGLALSPLGGLFVLSQGDSGVAAVDIASHSVAHIALGGANLQSIAAPAGRESVWVAAPGFGTNGLSLLNTGSDHFLLNFPQRSGVIAFSPSGLVLYDGTESQFLVLDGKTLQQLAAFPLPQLSTIGSVLASPDGKYVYYTVSYVSGKTGGGAVLWAPGELVVVDTATFTQVAAVPFNEGMGSLAITPDSATLLCTSNFGRVILVDTATHTKTGSIKFTPANGLLNSIAITPDGATAYVTDSVNNLVLVADLATKLQTSQLPVALSPGVIAITADASEAWVVTSKGVQVIGIAAGGENDVISLPDQPSNLVFVP